MFNIVGIDHLVLRTRDPKNLVEFYCRVLGCRVEREQPKIGLVQLRAGDSLIDILAVGGECAPGSDHANLDHFCLRVDPFNEDDIRKHLSQYNIDGSELRRVYGAEGVGPAIYIKDPDSNVVELKGQPE
ncbi:MAG: VOC family protein [Pseudomonadales bacterium]|nr:VOC family protein [Pseudomonadales bacterium]